MTYKIKKMINNGTEYKIGSIDSSNETYENIIHLTQEEYDALETKDPDTLYSTPESESPGTFSPENAGTTGQVLTKTETGYAYCDGPKEGVYVDILVVGGGGGGGQGGYCAGGGGGGGGGVLLERGIKVEIGKGYTVCVGNGGSTNNNGGDSYFGNYYAFGGGAGGNSNDPNCGCPGCDGGSGGGGSGGGNNRPMGGLAIKNSGAFGTAGYGGVGALGGGGGGAGGVNGINLISSCTENVAGGRGLVICKFSDCVKRCYGAGGGGGGYSCNCVSTAHDGGGAGGAAYTGTGGNASTCGSGGGGGGFTGNSSCARLSGGSGAKGIVIIRYDKNGSGITCSTGGNSCTITNIDNICYCVHCFTSNGTFCIEA